jgi:pimeloyl-ACP methyl ester carboxylesterase
LSIEQNRSIIFIHGFAAHWSVLWPCSLYLRRLNYEPLFWTYPTLTQSIAKSANDFKNFIRQIDDRGNSFHVIAHSMGSIVTRFVLQDFKPRNLDRIVLLAPPITGLPAACRSPQLLKRWIPALNELSDKDGICQQTAHDEIKVPTLVIAARFDVLIPIQNTHLVGQSEHCVFTATHNSLLFDPRVFRKISEFLS